MHKAKSTRERLARRCCGATAPLEQMLTAGSVHLPHRRTCKGMP